MAKADSVEKWLGVIAQYEAEFKKWDGRAQKIVRRYRDERQGSDEGARFNILWSNVQTLIPAVFARLPKAEVRRRYGDTDPVGRVASLLLERALDFEVEHYPDYRSALRHVVEDRFLCGRGVSWVRYEPHFRAQPGDGLQVTEDADEAPQEMIEYECAPVDYVYWKDFGHSLARTWEEVTAVWRWVYMTREALVERFGKAAGSKIPLDSGPDPEKSAREFSRARICELWDKEQGRVYWLSKSMSAIIDSRDDPLHLEGFFPCPPPLYATTTSDSLVPVPDFVLYQDQANELDVLSDRIDGLVKSLRVRGVYDASQPALQRLLTEGENNALIPVDKWLAFAEKGGLKGSLDLLPLDMLSSALLQCYQARADIKGQIYEITGIADILRGHSMASETATAQQIKGKFASLRLRSIQDEVALFASALLRLKAQIMCSQFQPQTLLAFAAAGQMNPADQALLPQAVELLRDNPLRNFRVDVAADSLVQIDEAQNKQDRIEFMTAFGGFLQQALPVAQASPQIAPMLVEVMKFGVGAFKQAAPIEGAIDQAVQRIAEAPPQEAAPDPEMVRLQAQQQTEQVKAQTQERIEAAKMQADVQLEQMRTAAQQELAAQKQQFDAQMDAERTAAQQELERYKAELEAETKIRVAQIQHHASQHPDDINVQQILHERLVDDIKSVVNGMAEMNQQALASASAAADRMDTLAHLVAAPKRVVRGEDGRVIAVEVQTG